MRISDWSSDVCSSDLHGAALRDEHHFRPGLFMGKETFAARMALLARQGYPVIALDIAVAALPTGQWPRGATIVTIDDGWFGTYRQMAPVLRAHGFPALLYIASRSEEHTSELQSLMRTSYAVFCLTNKKHTNNTT